MATAHARNVGSPLMNLVMLKGVPILQQLQLEEQLLRTSSDNWCIINDGTDKRNIVMGISGKPAELLEITPVLRDNIPVIRRFTGGGTVIVDHQTIFISFLCNKDAVPDVQPYPRPIMTWSSLLYGKVFQEVGDFKLRENEMGRTFWTTKNSKRVDHFGMEGVLQELHLVTWIDVRVNASNLSDYVFGSRKFGGNAQSITKSRWIHHTSFLWDFDTSNMAYLKLPKRAPEYRQARDHLDFVCRLKEYLPKSDFIDGTVEALRTQFSISSMELGAVESLCSTDFTHTSKLLTKEELEAAAT